MILLLSGEGPTDIGSCAGMTGEASGANFDEGPMAMVIDRLVTPIWNYSPKSTEAFVFISESALDSKSKEIRGMSLPGTKKAKGTALFGKQARALARLAKERTADECPVGAVLFRDADGTRSDPKTLWKDKHESIENGFAAEGFALGVAMVPKPKSEAWLLCAAQENPYNNCVRFEDVSGNDRSPNNAKDLLAEALGKTGKTPDDICDLIDANVIDALRIDMPSYNHFRNRMEEVARIMIGQPTGQ